MNPPCAQQIIGISLLTKYSKCHCEFGPPSCIIGQKLRLDHPHYLIFMDSNRLCTAESNLAGPRLSHTDNFKSICLLQNAIERSQGAERKTRKYANAAESQSAECQMSNCTIALANTHSHS